MTAPRTFDTKRDAQQFLAQTQTDLSRGAFIDHRAGQVTFLSYATEFIANGGTRGRLAPRTAELYTDLITRDLEPLHRVTIASVKPQDVRSWYTSRAAHPTRRRQAYALAKAVFGTAVRDRLIASNPCTIVGAGVAKADERPYLSPDVLATIVDRMPQHYRTPLHVMFGAHLRLGELVGLQRGDFDAEAATLRVERQVIDVNGRRLTTPTKTGQARTVALPPSTAAMLKAHISATKGAAKSPMFLDYTGRSSLTRNATQQAWRKATKALGLDQFHVHDVRHAGLTLAAQAGATTRELMARAGHRTTAAAMTYQHVAEERSALLAERMDALSAASATGTYRDASGTYRAREAIVA
ncbi:site-specific integrase [Microbacterium sp. HD4P20]|uniref:tyrosine-type recombinase/integrase n=1 Tax=Microbacterium sp. HD4P20 TaxID=2864874 RepID=UPI001C6427A1|nr:site-specific integrase [Microbacterium sp. HD4P20]MCP2636773.1 site-specific integrase [Microbacterium sp. HD4P20]